MGRRKAAIADYETAIRAGYPTPVAYYNVALLLQEERRFPEALTRYLEAVEVDPGMWRARVGAAELAEYMRRYDLALKLAEGILAAFPDDAKAKERVTRIKRLVEVSVRRGAKGVPAK
jgi:tetratricopeptide (TPR) repeat protein